MERSYPKNPASPEAMTVSEVGPGVSFAIIENGQQVRSGTFVESTCYDGDEWLPVKAKMEPDGHEQIIGMYATGIVCQPNGEWLGSRFAVQTALVE